MRKIFGRRMAGIALALAAAGVATAPGALADAEGSTKYNYGTTYIKVYSHGGSGTDVRRATTGHQGFNSICNYQFKLRFYNNTGGLYLTVNGPYHSGCDRDGTLTPLDWYPSSIYSFREGRVCGELYTNGVLTPRPCVSLY